MSGAQGVPHTATFTILSAGREIDLNKDMRKRMGFRRGRVIGLISPLAKAIVDGGYYRVERLDGSLQAMDLQHDLHRLSFVPSPTSKRLRDLRNSKIKNGKL